MNNKLQPLSNNAENSSTSHADIDDEIIDVFRHLDLEIQEQRMLFNPQYAKLERKNQTEYFSIRLSSNTSSQ